MQLPFWPCLKTDKWPSLSCFVDIPLIMLSLWFLRPGKSPQLYDTLLNLLGLWSSVPSHSSCRIPVFQYPGVEHCSSLPCSAHLMALGLSGKEGQWWVFSFLIFVNLIKFLVFHFLILSVIHLQIFCSAFIFSNLSHYIIYTSKI